MRVPQHVLRVVGREHGSRLQRSHFVAVDHHREVGRLAAHLAQPGLQPGTFGAARGVVMDRLVAGKRGVEEGLAGHVDAS